MALLRIIHMEYIPRLLEIRNATEIRLDELNQEINELIAEQLQIRETLKELLGELEHT